MDIKEAHDTMGHKGETLIKKTLKMIGCHAKAKQCTVSNTTNIKAEKPGQRIF
jgi:hypothetical protein